MGSGGHNRLSLADHQLRNNVRPHRHVGLPPASPEKVSPSARRQTLRGLPAPARRLAARLLDEYSPWDAASLHTLRAYALSVVRLEQLQNDVASPTTALAREVRINLSLLKSLELERP